MLQRVAARRAAAGLRAQPARAVKVVVIPVHDHLGRTAARRGEVALLPDAHLARQKHVLDLQAVRARLQRRVGRRRCSSRGYTLGHGRACWSVRGVPALLTRPKARHAQGCRRVIDDDDLPQLGCGVVLRGDAAQGVLDKLGPAVGGHDDAD